MVFETFILAIRNTIFFNISYELVASPEDTTTLDDSQELRTPHLLQDMLIKDWQSATGSILHLKDRIRNMDNRWADRSLRVWQPGKWRVAMINTDAGTCPYTPLLKEVIVQVSLFSTTWPCAVFAVLNFKKRVDTPHLLVQPAWVNKSELPQIDIRVAFKSSHFKYIYWLKYQGLWCIILHLENIQWLIVSDTV